MYSVHRQLHPVTGLEQSLYCNFFNANEKNLIIAGVNVLQVFRLNSNVESKTDKGAEKGPDQKTKKDKLECLGTYQLFGSVMSMASVQLAGSSRDALLLSFRDAKLSLVEYDPGTHDLKTSSLHYFEEEELKDGHLQQDVHVPVVRVDPEGRCAAMLVYGTRLVVLPFRKDVAAEDADGLISGNKTPIMSSYIIDLRKLNEKIINVIDVQFLHGYYEPTVLILYEPLPTWSGRVAVRKDSCSIVAISLNIQEKVHPIIWSLGNLPFDSLKIFPVMKPIGGVVLFAVNSLLYLNQSFPPYGVALNSLTDFNSEFLLKAQPGVKISLDCAQGAFIEYDKMVISLKGGELYVLTLLIDGMRAVRGFNLDKAAASVLTTCMCVCEEGYLFLGSRLGNSLLLKFIEKQFDFTFETKSFENSKKDEPPTKKRKDTVSDWMASDVSAIDDLDELEVYGAQAQQPGTGHITQFSFEVCDSIMNIGPCGQMVMGEPAFLSEEFGSSIDPDIELVTTSGFGKNGAISVLQRSIRPQVVTTFELPGCTDMWTVIGPMEGGKDGNDDAEKNKTGPESAEDPTIQDTHALLIISRDDSSMILQTGQEIMELDHSGFSTQGPTICAGNIGDNKYIIQVSPMGVRLMEGVNQVQHIPIDVGSPIVACSIADPYVVIMSQEGHIMMLTLRQDSFGSGVRLAVARPQMQQKAKAVAICAHRDVSGLFVTETSSDPALKVVPEVTTPKTPIADPLSKSTVDDEDELLYGDSEMPGMSGLSDCPDESPNSKQESSEQKKGMDLSQPTYWTVICRDNGVLEIYSLPDFKLVFIVKNFPMGQKVLVDSGLKADKSASVIGLQEKLQDIPLVKEIIIVGLGNKASHPHLMARVDDELFIYEAFSYFSSANEGHLQLRFKKIPHGLILKEKKGSRTKKTSDEYDGTEVLRTERVHWLRPFQDISGYSGLFVCGPYPHWLFMTPRGCLRIHPMSIDGTVICFTPFHNVNCPKGFLYFNRQGELRISVLPTHLSYDAPWPVRKVPLRCTPHYVTYHPETKTYAVVTSTQEICNRVVKVVGDGEKEFETQERDDRFIFPSIDRFSIQLFSPVSWEPIPNTRFEFDDFEHVTCVEVVNLVSEGTLSGLKGYVAVGTNYNYNEEVTSRGRILIFDVIEVVPEPGQPLTKNKMKIEYNKDQKGPVTALGQVNGYLVSAIGQKVYIWQLKHDELSGVAFIDTQIYIHSMVIIKNLILVGDIFKSICLMRYQTDLKVLSMVSRDVKPLEVYGIQYLVDNTTLCFMVSDRMKNIIVYTYQPEVRESFGGQRLLRRADFHADTHINTFFRIRCKLSDPSSDKQAASPIDKRHVTFYASLDGSIGYVLPVSEKTFRRLQMLQNALNTHIQHAAGLNPKAYRTLRQESRMLCNVHRNILDGDLLWKFLNLSSMEKNELAKRIGTGSDQIIDDLMEIDRTTAHF